MNALKSSDPVVCLGNRLLTWLTDATKKPALLPIRMWAVLAMAAAMGLTAMSSTALAARKTCEDGSYPPCNTSGETEAGNRLSYPAVLIPGLSIAPFFEALEGTLGQTWSYGCQGTETLEQFEYPNISCVNDLQNPTVYYTAAECTADGGKCDDQPVDRIYWQKEADNEWSAQVTGLAGTLTPLPVPVRFVDWGDSIESVSWNENSVLRVETQPFADLSQDPLVELGSTQTQYGFQMWHVSGQGTTEHWGVRVTEETDLQGLPYVYQSPYAIINGGTAELYLSKLFGKAADDADYACPDAEGDVAPVYPVGYGPDEDGFTFPGRSFTPGVGWSGACNLPVIDYTVELSVSGKFVHGYNWRMRELTNPLPLALCGDTTWQKTGWWRLTFVPDGGAGKMAFVDGTAVSAPAVPDALPTDLSAAAVAAEAESETTGTLYTPSVDAVDNLTYIDICILKKPRGGGKKTK